MENAINAIMIKRLGINFVENKDLANECFFGQRIKAPIHELLLSLIDIEKEFHIHLSEQKIIDGKYDTYNHVIELVREEIEEFGVI